MARAAWVNSVSFGDLLGSFVGALACIACWRGLSALVRREVAAGRKSLRYWWPTAMLTWSWFMLWATSFPSASAWLGVAKDPLLIAFFGVNLPGAVVGNGLLGVLVDLPDGVKATVASTAVWGIWFGVLVFWERRRAGRGSVRITG